MSEPRVALVHDWLTGMRGGEKVLEALCELLSDADIFTLFHRRGSVSPTIERHPIRTSFVQRLPLARTHYRTLPAALPDRHRAVRPRPLRPGHQLEPLRGQGGRRARDARAISATATRRCGTPGISSTPTSARRGSGRLASRWFYRPVLSRLARWDAATAARVHRFVANSAHVAGRIRRYYNREATIVYPPVDTVFYHPAAVTPESHFLIVSALVPYKRIDLAIDACERVGAPLRIVGDGPDRARLAAQRRAPA